MSRQSFVLLHLLVALSLVLSPLRALSVSAGRSEIGDQRAPGASSPMRTWSESLTQSSVNPAAGPSWLEPFKSTPSPVSLLLSLAAQPLSVAPSGIITFTVVLTNTLADRGLSGLVVSDTLPLNLAYRPVGESEFSYWEDEHRVQWAIARLAPGATLTGTFQAQVTTAVIGQVITNTVAVGEEEADVQAQAMVTLTVASPPCLGSDCTPTPVAAPTEVLPTATPTEAPPPCLGSDCTPTEVPPTVTPTWTPTPTATPGPGVDEVWLMPGEGGVLMSADGRVQVEAPPGAVSRRTLLRYVPQPLVGETPAWLTIPFGLEAQDEQGAGVTQFEALVHLTYRFPPSAALTETMRLYQWVDAAGAWQALDSQMDVVGRQLTAELAGVGLFGVGDGPALSYGAQHLPTVHGFVTDEWSGNSSLSYPLALPPGPGGLGLNLSLSYSSEGVNSIRQGPTTYTVTVPGPTPTATQVVDGDAERAMAFNRQASLAVSYTHLQSRGGLAVRRLS